MLGEEDPISQLGCLVMMQGPGCRKGREDKSMYLLAQEGFIMGPKLVELHGMTKCYLYLYRVPCVRFLGGNFGAFVNCFLGSNFGVGSGAVRG